MLKHHSLEHPRRSRHTAGSQGTIWLEGRDLERGAPVIVSARLANFSSRSLELRIAARLVPLRDVVVRIQDETRGLNQTFAVQPRWQLREDDGQFTVGCELEESMVWQTLGEHFLTDMLSV